MLIMTGVVSATNPPYDPKLNWQVIESPHFSVHFSQNKNNPFLTHHYPCNEQVAQQVAGIAEEVYAKVNAQLGPPKHYHFQKIAIILEDFSDYTLGFATSFPHRVIRISLTIPNAKTFDMKFRSWLKMVITHEYTHIAHFEMTRGYTTALRALFGQIILPNALQPIWSIEGLAVYNETQFTSGGRGIDSRYDMYLRMAALEDQFNTLDQISGYYLTSWPAGTAPYIYGQSLIHYIAEHYGEDKLIEISEIFTRHPLLGINYALKRTLKLSLDELYQTWKDSIVLKYKTQMQNIISLMPITTSKQLTNYHSRIDYPRWITTSEGFKIAIKVSNPHSFPFIRLINPKQFFTPFTFPRIDEQLLVKRTYGRDSSYDISSDYSTLIYAKLDNFNRYYRYYDLYFHDIKTKKEIRLSKGLRARDPIFSSSNSEKDHQKIIAIVNQSGTNNLISIDLKHLQTSTELKLHNLKLISNEDVVYLTHLKENSQLYHPALSPNGNIIALSVWQNGALDICTLNLKHRQIGDKYLSLLPIFQDQYNDLSPNWSPDGKFLFFSSDRTGIYNIFAFSISDKKLYQVTNVIGGAFEPSISPDGQQLAYIEYHASGYELHVMNMEPSKWIEIKYNNISSTSPVVNYNPEVFSPKNKFSIHSYHPLSSFWQPTYWIPAVQMTGTDINIGFSSELHDLLGYHSLPFTMTYNLFQNNLCYFLNYYNYEYKSSIHLYASGNTSSLSQDKNITTPQFSLWEKGKIGLNINFPFEGNTSSNINSRCYQSIFSLGYQYEKIANNKSSHSSHSSGSNSLNDNFDKITSLRLKYTYSDAEKYELSISPEQGQAFSINYEHADSLLGGDYSFDKLLFDGRKFIPLPSLHHTLSLRLIAGYSSKNILDREKFNLGGHYSADNLSNVDLDTFSLRGYSPNTLEGNNLLLTSLEYRFPIANIERGLKQGPFFVFLERLSGTIFVDIGSAWDSIQKSKNIKIENNKIDSDWPVFKTGIGAELKADLNLKYDSPFTLRLGAAKALSDPRGYDIYFEVGTSF